MSTALQLTELTRESESPESYLTERVVELWPEQNANENMIALAQIHSVASQLTPNDTASQHPLLSVYLGLQMLSMGLLSLTGPQLSKSWQLLMQLAEEELNRLQQEREQRETRKRYKPQAAERLVLHLPSPVELLDRSKGTYMQLQRSGFHYDHVDKVWRAWADDTTRALHNELKYTQSRVNAL